MKPTNVLIICCALLLGIFHSQAAIITTPQMPTEGGWYSLRKEFTLGKTPKHVELSIAVDSKYWLWINGELRIFEGGLKQGPTPTDNYIDMVENLQGLHAGKNTVALLVWWYGKDSFSHRTGKMPAVDFNLTCDKHSIVSDGTWRMIQHPAYYIPSGDVPNFRLPESNIGFDARKTIDWTSPQFDDSSWQTAVETDKQTVNWGNYVHRPIPQWRDYGLRDYTSVRRDGNKLIAHLPYNCHATPYLKIRAKGGETIDIRTDNYEGGSALNVRAEYVARSGEQEYESLGWMNGHQIIYTVPESVEVIEVKYRETGYDCDLAGAFDCDDQFLNSLWLKAQRTLYLTMRDTYMDCPDRERAQWWGDVVNELGESFYALDRRADMLTRKGILELMAYQRTDSTIYAPVPSAPVSWNKELPMQMLASVSYYGFWTYYMGTGDRETIERVYPAVKRYLEVWRTDTDGLVVARKGEWTWGDWGNEKDMELLFNLWYAIALDGFEKMSSLVGEHQNAAWAHERSQRLKTAFHARYWNGTCYRSVAHKGETDDRAQALAVVAGVVPVQNYPLIAKLFKQEYHASPYMEKYVLEALCRMGYPDQALERMKLRYREMVDSRLSTLWEGWGIGDKGFGGGTTNHAWSGGALTILSEFIAGVSPIEPGFRKFALSPMPTRLKRIDTKIPTSYGNIEVTIKRAGSKLDITVRVPARTKCVFTAPQGTIVMDVNGRSYRGGQATLSGARSHRISCYIAD